MVGSYIEVEVVTKGGETFTEVQELLQFGWSERYNYQVAVVDKYSPTYFAYPSGIRLLSLNWESQIAKAKVISWEDPYQHESDGFLFYD